MSEIESKKPYKRPFTIKEAQGLISDRRNEEVKEDPELKKVFVPEHRATYKIEVRFGSKRTTTEVVARVDFWLSGKSVAGDLDDHMFLCGYSDCYAPVHPDFMRGEWAVCPTCSEAGRNNGGVQVASVIEATGLRLHKEKNVLVQATSNSLYAHEGRHYPSIRDCILISTTAKSLAELLASYWDKLGGDADLYVKYHPSDIRAGVLHKTYEGDYDPSDEYVQYDMDRIVKDVSTGASLVNRFLALIQA